MNSILSRHKRLGHYQVGNLSFTNRGDAEIASSVTGVKPYFYFNDSVYSGIDWTVPIDTSLDDLYKTRALQLREKYDHLCLFLSGGADSVNILNTFVRNNIHLDEVISYYPKVLENELNTRDLSSDNTYSEVKYAALPVAMELLKNTNTKYRIIDWCDLTLQYLSNEKLVQSYSSVMNISITAIPRTAMYTLDPVWRSIQDKGKTVCCIIGADKPKLNVDEKGLYHSFCSHQTHSFVATENHDINKRLEELLHVELFYYTPDLPQILIKQCQVIKNKCDTDKRFSFIMKNKAHINPELIKCELINTLYNQDARMGRNLFTTFASHSINSIFSSQYNWMDKAFDEGILDTKNKLGQNYIKCVDKDMVKKIPIKNNYLLNIGSITGKKYYF